MKIHFSYAVEEIARTFGVHKNTVRAWLKQGLPKIDESRPILVHGRELRAFLENRRKAARRCCPPGTLYCLKCREPRSPAFGMVDYIPITGAAGNLRALCSTCEKLIHRRVGKAHIATVMPNIAVQITHHAQHIRESDVPSLECDSGKDDENHD